MKKVIFSKRERGKEKQREIYRKKAEEEAGAEEEEEKHSVEYCIVETRKRIYMGRICRIDNGERGELGGWGRE